MKRREIFKKIAHFKLPGKVFLPSCWQWFWEGTITRWKKEGLPGDVWVEEFFEFDRMEILPLQYGVLPSFEAHLLEEKEDYRIYIDKEGVKKKEFVDKIGQKRAEGSMPQWLEFPVKDRKTWNEFKKRLNPHSPARYPLWWEEEKKRWEERDYPLGLMVGSFYGWLRNWVGMENLSLMFYDNPSLVHEMMEYLEWFILELIKKAVEEIEFDFAHFWEDMAYKTASLISPQLFREFMLPHYKKITEFLRKKGIDLITVDSDGNVEELIPLWLEGGVNGILPLEVAAGMDAVSLRKKYGKDLILIGNIDKRVLAKDKKEIKEEVMRKVPLLLSRGGYFPGVDHAVPPDVPFENYGYYLELIRELDNRG